MSINLINILINQDLINTKKKEKKRCNGSYYRLVKNGKIPN